MANRWLKAVLVYLGATVVLAPSGTASSVRILFASLEEGREILGTRDGFIQRLSPFDRASRLKTDREVSEPEFLKFVASKVLAWDSADRDKIEEAIERIQPALAEFSLYWPESVHFIQTTGEEEGGCGLHSRGGRHPAPDQTRRVPGEALPTGRP